MHLARRPSAEQIETYRVERLEVSPSHPSTAPAAEGYREDVFSRSVGHGQTDFEAAREGLRRWVGHRHAGFEVSPADAALEAGSTVALLTRQLGIWVLAACRVEQVIDEPDRFGFIYATLPGHPVRGHETFVLRSTKTGVWFDIVAVSKPDSTLVRVSKPVGIFLQRRITERYLDGIAEYVAAASGD
ncbi:MAG: DUF1990 domain-containing protein [Actinomycetota bacterium]